MKSGKKPEGGADRKKAAGKKKPAEPKAMESSRNKEGSASSKAAKKPARASVKPAKAAKAGKASEPAPAKPKASSPRKAPPKPASLPLVSPVSGDGKRPLRAVRPKTFEQSPATREAGFPSATPEPPEQYLRDHLVLMTQQPDYLFTYWEITEDRLHSKESEKRADENYREAIKLNWPPQSLFDDNFALLPVSFAARRWYLRVPHPGLMYQAEIGWLGSNGDFISILSSNPSESPEDWEASLRRLREEGEVLAYSARHARHVGSSEHMLAEERIFAPNWTPGVSSSMPGSAGGRKKNLAASAP